MKKYMYAIIFMASLFISAQENTTDKEQKWTGARPDSHAPIAVSADHTHSKGGIMFSYKFMYMNMEDLNQNSENIEFAEAILPNGNYMVTPTDMPMDMHMIGMMYAPSDKITLMAMTSYIAMNMNHLTATGGTFNTESSGLGDTKITALYSFFNKNRQHLHGHLGISIPTGSIEAMDITPASSPNEVILPYPMQIGSGTVDALIGFTYLKQWNGISFGSQAKATFRTGKNDNDYRLGNQYRINNWLAVITADWLSFSGRLELGAIDKIEGANPALNPMMVITADTNNSGMTYANAGLGFNIYAFKGGLKNLRVGAEASLPLFQNMNGIQLRNKETISLGIQYAL